MKILQYILISAVLLLSCSLFSISIKNDSIYLDIEILSNTDFIHIKNDNPIVIKEADSPFQIEFHNPDLTFELIDKPNTYAYYIIGIRKFYTEQKALNYISKSSNLQYQAKESIYFKDGEIQQLTEFNIYHNKQFTDYQEAKLYAKKNFLGTDFWIEERLSALMQDIVIYNNYDKKRYYLSPPLEIICNGITTVYKVPKSNFWHPKEFVTREYEGNFSALWSATGKLNLINTIDLENYVCGVVPNEIGINVPEEALKAQAVAARTDALYKVMHQYHKDDNFDLCASVHCQIYSGITGVNERIKKAVFKTKSIVCTYNGQIIDAVYCNNCGGHTEDKEKVWGGTPLPYLQGKYDSHKHFSYNLTDEAQVKKWIKQENDVFCRPDVQDKQWIKNSYHWVKEYPIHKIEEKMTRMYDIGKIRNIKVIERGSSGRITKLKIVGSKRSIILDRELNIRNTFFGLPSSLFYFEKKNGKYIFEGKGSGHGVGMCQMGTINLAKKGYSYKKILSHYYTGIQIEKISY